MIEPLPNYNSTTTFDNNIRARKKPGRKSNPSSQALRREQNRVAQRVFRERKSQHVLELEEKGREFRNECDKLMSENKALYSGIGALSNERQHLKGLMMSLQLVCFINNVKIPSHDPYLNKEYLERDIIQNSSVPEMARSYKKAKDLHKFPTTGEQVKKPASTLSMEKSGEYVTTGTILVNHNSVRTVVGNRVTAPLPEIRKQQQCYPIIPSVSLLAPMWQKPSIDTTATITLSSTKTYMPSNQDSNSETSNNDAIQHTKNRKVEEKGGSSKSLSFKKKSIALSEGTLPLFDLAKFQTMRLQLQLQAVCGKLGSNFKLTPTKLQLKIPHDLRIDLIPVSTIRDRMIILQDSYDIDDCISCLLDGMIYHHGDPLKTASWKFSIEFYEKFWYLTDDYSVEEIKKRWPTINQLYDSRSKVSLLDDTTLSTQQYRGVPIDSLNLGLLESSDNITTSDQIHYPPSLSSENSDYQSLREEELYSMTGNTADDDFGIPWRNSESQASNSNYITR
ncbi:hypothetical protein INT45_006703 [Circinella minor]|uniref:BZIP domain-containing protein n=1 Tax=Circinella minor TaxID=1195481 RepID=A0A8H7S4K4_9FUNG|nr:hypothetical protein INT45_006703 [Circinella minor]